MNERIERSVTAESSSVVAQAMNAQYKNLLELGVEVAKERGCADCANLALCGIAINILRSKKVEASTASTGAVNMYGVEVDRGARSVCPGKLIDEAIRRNEQDDFWILNADELNGASLEVRAAQTVKLAAESVHQAIGNKAVI